MMYKVQMIVECVSNLDVEANSREEAMQRVRDYVQRGGRLEFEKMTVLKAKAAIIEDSMKFENLMH